MSRRSTAENRDGEDVAPAAAATPTSSVADEPHLGNVETTKRASFELPMLLPVRNLDALCQTRLQQEVAGAKLALSAFDGPHSKECAKPQFRPSISARPMTTTYDLSARG
jgi:hypothetical protein